MQNVLNCMTNYGITTVSWKPVTYIPGDEKRGVDTPLNDFKQMTRVKTGAHLPNNKKYKLAWTKVIKSG